MSDAARIDLSNEVCLYYYSSNYSFITIADSFTVGGDIAVIDLQGSTADWLGKNILQRASGYTGPIPNTRFRLGNFVYSSKIPIVGYHIDSGGILVQD
jgi:hypothetical protein